MGLNEENEIKYFLGMNFVQKKQVNKYQLKNDFIEQIKRIFTLYLEPSYDHSSNTNNKSINLKIGKINRN